MLVRVDTHSPGKIAEELSFPIGSGHFNAWGERRGRTAPMKLASRSDVLWEGNGHREAKNIQSFTVRASTHARDQAPSFDTPGGAIQRAVADILPSYLYCAAKIGRRKFGFGAPKTKKLSGSQVPHFRDRDNRFSLSGKTQLRL